MRRIGNLIGFQPIEPTSGRTSPVFNPATGEQIAELGLSSDKDVDAAVEAAKTVLPSWANTAPQKRARVMFRFKELLEANGDAIAEEISREHGKTHADALGEVQRGLEVVEFACGIPHLLAGAFTRNVGPAIDSYSDRQPLGIVAGITPFNFPAMVPLWMYPIAIACGNCFILKPSERDPSAPLFIAGLLQEAGLPAGVFNIVNGDKAAVDAILHHRDIKAVSFVGSTPIAQYIYAAAATSGKRCQALGGAKNHMVVMPDADLDQAADALVSAGYGSAGERCMAISVAVPVGDRTADALVDRLVPRIQKLRVGPASDPQAEMGPLVTRQHRDKVLGYIEAGVREGAELVVDGRNIKLQGYEEGYFVGPTLFDRVTAGMSIYREEIFGPVLSMVRARDYEHAAGLINDHEYGNGTAIYTRDGDAARAFADAIEIGMIGVNVPIPVPVAYHSFGGWKRSLFGDHAIYGPDGVRFYTRLKTVTSRWPAGIRAGVSLNFPSLN
jgi:malonate-semialdehyde dehydrogenase (acetylating)/methylmalonate-semialdehyde dehydrogenase